MSTQFDKHTPRPWHIAEYAKVGFAVADHYVIKNGGKTIAFIDANLNGPSARTAACDAHLIAASPELLAACKAALECITSTGRDTKSDRAIVQIQAAITKAIGGEA